jgi:hypothetical protein
MLGYCPRSVKTSQDVLQMIQNGTKMCKELGYKLRVKDLLQLDHRFKDIFLQITRPTTIHVQLIVECNGHICKYMRFFWNLPELYYPSKRPRVVESVTFRHTYLISGMW